MSAVDDHARVARRDRFALALAAFVALEVDVDGDGEVRIDRVIDVVSALIDLAVRYFRESAPGVPQAKILSVILEHMDESDLDVSDLDASDSGEN